MPKYKYCDNRDNNKDTILQSDDPKAPNYMSDEEAAGWVEAHVLELMPVNKQAAYARKDVKADAA